MKNSSVHITPDSIHLSTIMPGAMITAGVARAVAEASKGDGTCIGGGKQKGFTQVGVTGGAAVGSHPVQQGAWIRAFSLDNAAVWSHMEIVDGSFNCGQHQVTVRKISSRLPKHGVGIYCTNANYTLRAGKGGWVKYVSLHRPQRGRIGPGRGGWVPEVDIPKL